MTIATTTDTRSVVLAWSDALDRHDVDAFMAFYGQDIIFVNYGRGVRLEGLEATRQDVEGLLAMISGFRLEVTRLLVEEGQFAKVWVMSGTSTGGAGLPPAGQPIRFHGVGVGQVRDGRIVYQTEYFNPVELSTAADIV